ncbi:hypothetical protein LEMLEM_LOCUS9098, partial [Lemmus lemmus]
MFKMSKIIFMGGGEMAQRLGALPALPKGPEFNSRQPHGSSQPSVMRSGALFWPAYIHRQNIVYVIIK